MLDWDTFYKYTEEECLMYYDGPLSYFTKNEADQWFFVHCIKQEDLEWLWYVVAVSPARKRMIETDGIDIKDIFLQSESGTYYHVIEMTKQAPEESTPSIKEQDVSYLNLNWLPEAGINFDLTWE